MYFLLHGEHPDIEEDQDSKEQDGKEIKKLHFSKKIKKREKQELNFTLESLERLVIHPDFRSNITSNINTPPGEKQPQVNQYKEQMSGENKKASLSSNAFIDPFITRQQTTIDAKIPSLSSAKERPTPKKEITQRRNVNTKVKESTERKRNEKSSRIGGVVLKQTPLQSMSKREERLLIEELEHKFQQSVRKQLPTPKQVMLKLPIRSPTTPEPGPLPPLVQEAGIMKVEDRKERKAEAEKRKEKGKSSLLENYMKRLDRKPKSRNLGQPQLGHKSMIGSSGCRSTASQSFIRHC